jgi:hypothetical protein
MPRKSFQTAEQIFRENNGLLRTGQAKRLGIHEPTLIQLWQAGLLEKEARGLYRLADLPPLSHPDLVQIAMRVPKAVFCLISALDFHQLTTQIPHKLYIAIPRETKAPRIEYPSLDIIYLSKRPYSAGVPVGHAVSLSAVSLSPIHAATVLLWRRASGDGFSRFMDADTFPTSELIAEVMGVIES